MCDATETVKGPLLAQASDRQPVEKKPAGQSSPHKSAPRPPVLGTPATIDTPHGSADAYFAAPAKGRFPAVLIWPDVIGLRPAFEQMATRLAEAGYAVLVVNQFYRSKRAPILQPGEDWRQPEPNAKIQVWRQALDRAATASDANAFVDWLDRQKAVDGRRGLATIGYCDGGAMAMITAAVRSDRVRAGASFHGTVLARNSLDSPHLLVPLMDAHFIFAIAQNDDERDPQEKERLRKAFSSSQNSVEIEVYEGAMHGWCPIDSRAYHHDQAEKAWSRQLELFERAL